MTASAQDVIATLERSGLVSRREASEYETNVALFEHRRAEIETHYAGHWVAALGGQLIMRESLSSMEDMLRCHADGKRAYVEFIGLAET